MRYAGFWRRTGATVIDTLIYAPLATLALLAIYGADTLAEEAPPAGLAEAFAAMAPRGFWDAVIQWLLPVLLVVVLWRRYGATPGKRLLHCRVVDAATLGAPSWSQALIRYLGYLVSTLPLCLGFLWVAWDRRKQAFHDKVARTVVLYAPEDEGRKSLAELMKESQ